MRYNRPLGRVMNRMLHVVIGLLFVLYSSAIVEAQSFPSPQSSYPAQATSSVMSQGRWVKIQVDKSGVYRLTDEELRQAGFVDPSRVGVYGFGGGVLPEDIRRITAVDVPRVPVYREGGALYFYGVGPITWFYDKDRTRYRHTVNTYARAGYYLLSDAEGPREMKLSSPPTVTAKTINTYTEVLLHEQELTSLKHSGRDLYGESFAFRTEQEWMETLPPNCVGQEAVASMRFIYPGTASSTLSLMVNGSQAISSQIAQSSKDSYRAGFVSMTYGDRPIELTSENIKVRVNFSPVGQAAYLDYYEINAKAEFAYTQGRQMSIRLAHTDLPVQFVMGNAPSDFFVFAAPSSIDASVAHTGAGTVVLPPVRSGTDNYVAMRLADAYRPAILDAVPNQNLRGVENPDLIIITTNALRAEAERLARYHQDADGMKVLVCTQTEVFNEYTGGTPDATAYRLFAKTFYDRWRKDHSLQIESPMQLLLLGDGSYDNRKMSTEWQAPDLQRTEFLLTYQSLNSLDVYSYTSDGYFALLANDEPSYAPTDRPGARKQVVGIGRIPVRDVYEAAAVVDKTIRYAEDRTPGAWKTKAAFMADNGDGLSHAQQSVGISRELLKHRPDIMLENILLDKYQRVTINGQTTVPDAKRKLADNLESGVMLLNYNGHGGPAGWGDEQIITYNSVKKLKNKHLPIWITATCDFSNFDHFNTSAGEEVFLNPVGGGAEVITTTRVVYDIPNYNLNVEIMKQIFGANTTSNHRSQYLGSMLSNARNTLPGDTVNKMCFVLLGDPAVRLKFPSRQVKLNTINGLATGHPKSIPLHALQRVELKGQILTMDGRLDNQFEGKLFVTVYDSKQTVTLVWPMAVQDKIFKFDEYPTVIYAGIADVKQGEFNLSFIVPKDVIYGETNGKVNFYAFDPIQEAEATGVDESLYIALGGEGATHDVDPPSIEQCYVGSPDFQSGSEVNPTPLFVAEVFDRSGINISGLGPGHNLQLAIDGREDLTYNLNSYFTPSTIDAGRGRIVFVVPHLPEGDHSARFTVWDVHNNVASRDFQFRVVRGLAPAIAEIDMYPNPLTGDVAKFRIVTDQPGTELQCRIEIFDFSGRRLLNSEIYTINAEEGRPALLELPIGRALPNGLYLYRAIIGPEGGSKATESRKIVVNKP